LDYAFGQIPKQAGQAAGSSQSPLPGMRRRHAISHLGDTAWELFHRLNREEAQYYLSNRAADEQAGFPLP
jgi:hypothetical protein